MKKWDAVRFSCVLLLLVSGCSDNLDRAPSGASAQDDTTTSSVAGSVGHVLRSVIPNIESPVWITTIPRAKCRLHERADQDSTHGLTVYSDDRGAVLVHANADSLASKVVLALDCQDAAGATDQPIIDLSASLDAPPESQQGAPVTDPLQAQVPLKGDVMQPTQAELAARGYPARPDPVADKNGFSVWQRLVSSNSRRITDEPIATGRFFGGKRIGTTKDQLRSSSVRFDDSSGNWSGVVLLAYDVYTSAVGLWQVPAVSGDGSVEEVSGAWVGIDGYLDSSIVQAGTEQDAFFSPFFGSLTAYSAWYEYFPADAHTITGMAVYPGDQVEVVAATSDSAGNLNGHGGYGKFVVINATHPTYYTGIIGAPSGHAVPGDPAVSTAEFIMERAVGHLTRFGTTTPFVSQGVGTQLQSGNFQEWGDSPSVLVDMFNGSHELASASLSFETVDFHWLAAW